MKRLSYAVAVAAILISVFISVRIGAISLAGALALFVAPEFRRIRAIEKFAALAMIVSLITVALALPRR
jgi:amino acid transporter